MRIRTTTDLGGFLRTRRNEMGMDQATLARKAGTSRKWLTEVENGKPGVEIGMVLRTFRALDIAIDLSVDDQIIKTDDNPRPALAERRSNRTPVNLDQRKGATTRPAQKMTDIPTQLRSSDSPRKAAKAARSPGRRVATTSSAEKITDVLAQLRRSSDSLRKTAEAARSPGRKAAAAPPAQKMTDILTQLRSSDSRRKATGLPAKSSGFAHKSTRRSAKSVRS
jgi:HTH-type transcriptional regulator/antitoxin HipB